MPHLRQMPPNPSEHMGEFDLIAKYFQRPGPKAAGVDLGVGDDCALLRVNSGMQLAVSSDMLVEGRHFLSTVHPEKLGHKALAVNLSDLAACGATPLAFTLALALPRVDEAWLAGFSKGLFALADVHGIALVGGDTTAGPLNICITAMGQVPAGQALRRNGAQVGDDIYVSGTPGEARLALEVFRGQLRLSDAQFAHTRERMEAPTPRVALGQALRGVASSAVDVSDGLLGDLGHILQASGVAAAVRPDSLLALFSPELQAQVELAVLRQCALAGGDDYELVFTANPDQRDAVARAAQQAQTQVTRIGQIEAGKGCVLVDAQGARQANPFASFDHFAA
jgi:thiamine-monophosphate kinase